MHLKRKNTDIIKETKNSEDTYNYKAHLIGVIIGAGIGALLGYFINTESSMQTGILIGVVVGELLGLFYIEFTKDYS